MTRHHVPLWGLCVSICPMLLAAPSELNVVHPWDGSRTTPVHRIPIFDENGEQIIPDAPYPPPFSAKATCGPCHSYEVVREGWHFNSTKKGLDPGRIGEPWVWVDEKTGTQLTLSYRDWEGVWNPEDIGMTPWRFTQVFGRHMPGGDMGEPDEETPDSRWQVSGKVEINCLGCHGASPRQDQSEWAKQISRENFRWAATAANGLGEVGGMASRVHDTWAIYDGPNLDDTQWAVRPFVDYDLDRFDSRYYAIFDVEHAPPDERCLFCHSVYPVEKPRWLTTLDVHGEAGMGCAGCHRNDLYHRMVRGYEGEAGEVGDGTLEAFSCEGCHSGNPEIAGRFGAPYPQHRGLPPIHLERMSCTSCHSGPVPEDGKALTVRVSRINRMGIHGRARWFTDLPQVGEPVYARGEDGKIAPHRILWPAFWARMDNQKVAPISPDEVAERIGPVLEAEKQVGTILAVLATVADATGTPVLFHGNTVYRRNIDGEVDGEAYDGSLDREVWGWEFDGTYVPLTVPPKFDEEGVLDPDIESVILSVLEALRFSYLRKARPVMAFGNTVYWTGEEGWLETQEFEGQKWDVPFWGWLADGTVEPLVPDFVLRAVAEIDDRIQTLGQEQVALGLRALTDQEEGAAEYAYVSAGQVFRLDGNGNLVANEHPGARPFLWPLAHEVRPQAQSLGAGGCAECHRQGAVFFELVLAGTGPMVTRESGAVEVAELMGISKQAAWWGAWRETVLKPLSLPVCVVFLVLLLLHYSLFGSHTQRPVNDDREIVRHNAWTRIAHYLLFLSVFAVAGTGFIFLLGDADPLGTAAQGAARKIHWIVGCFMAAGMAMIVLLWTGEMFWASYDKEWLAAMGGYLGGRRTPAAGKFNAGQKFFFWWTLVVGTVLTVTGIAMAAGIRWSPVRQAQIYTIHDAAGLLVILSIMLHVYLSVLVDPHSIRSIFGGRVLASWARKRHSKWELAERTSPTGNESSPSENASGERLETDGRD